MSVSVCASSYEFKNKDNGKEEKNYSNIVTILIIKAA